MKALIYYGVGDVRIEEIPKPVAVDKDVVVKVARAGICGSDITAYTFDGHCVGIFEKGFNGFDGQFGHEMVGYVHEIGEDVFGCSCDIFFVFRRAGNDQEHAAGSEVIAVICFKSQRFVCGAVFFIYDGICVRAEEGDIRIFSLL